MANQIIAATGIGYPAIGADVAPVSWVKLVNFLLVLNVISLFLTAAPAGGSALALALALPLALVFADGVAGAAAASPLPWTKAHWSPH